MKKVYLHIGVHKTGSSSIQETFFKYRNEVKSQGFFYFCEDYDGVDRPLPQKWIDLNSFKTPFVKDEERFKSLIDKAPSENIIVSIEALAWFLSVESIESVRRALRGFDVSVVVYIRRQDKQMVSYHQEASKGKNKPSAVYYGASLTPLKNLKRTEYLDYNKRLRNWAKVFGKENIKVRLFEKKHLLDGDVVKDFSSLLSLELGDTVRVNESLGFEATKIGQLLNISNLNNIGLENKIRKICSNEGKLLPSRSDAISFYESYKTSNESLNDYFKIAGRLDVFDDDFSMYSQLGDEKWSEKNVNDVILKIFRAVEEYLSLKDRDYADLLRDDAIKLEKTNLNMSYFLMTRALELRPNGPVIKRKVAEYEEVLKIKKKTDY